MMIYDDLWSKPLSKHSEQCLNSGCWWGEMDWFGNCQATTPGRRRRHLHWCPGSSGLRGRPHCRCLLHALAGDHCSLAREWEVWLRMAANGCTKPDETWWTLWWKLGENYVTHISHISHDHEVLGIHAYRHRSCSFSRSDSAEDEAVLDPERPWKDMNVGCTWLYMYLIPSNSIQFPHIWLTLSWFNVITLRISAWWMSSCRLMINLSTNFWSSDCRISGHRAAMKSESPLWTEGTKAKKHSIRVGTFKKPNKVSSIFKLFSSFKPPCSTHFRDYRCDATETA